MAHSRPKSIANIGDASRLSKAAGAFIIELSKDPRVTAHYVDWRTVWATGKQHLDTMLAGSTRRTEADIRRSIDQFAADVQTGLERFVADLRIKPAWIPFVSQSLRELFQLTVYNERHPTTPKPFGIPVKRFRDMPAGKLPRAGGEDIVRGVRWYYRHHVQVAPDSIVDLARDYQSWANRDNDCRSVVQNGISQAETLLDLAAERWILLPSSAA